MTSPADISPGAGNRADTEWRMRAIAAELTAADLDAQVHQTVGVFDIRATVHPPGSKPVEIIYDEDGYTQVSYWSDPAAPDQVAAVLARALAAITGPS